MARGRGGTTAACGSATDRQAECTRPARPVTSPWRPRSRTPPDWAGFPTGRSSCPPSSTQRFTTSTHRGTWAATYDLSHLAWSTNDLVVAPDGRAYVDLYHPSPYGVAGEIGLLDQGGGVRVVATDLAVPNGLGFLPDGSTLVVNETNGSRLLEFPTAADGSLGTPSVFADLGPHRHPDGLCVDAEGGVWVGCYAASSSGSWAAQ